MGTGKKEAARRERQGKGGEGMNNVRTKGENFYRSAKRVKNLNMFKEGKAERNAQGEITKEAIYQTTKKPIARVEPNRKWFTNTRVISQDALAAFRGAIEERSKDPYSYLLKQNKLPLSLIRDGKDRKDGVVQHAAKIRIEGESFGDTFGPNARRKRPRLAVGSLEDMAATTEHDYGNYEERQAEARLASGAVPTEDAERPSELVESADGQFTTAQEPIFSKGQSKRIWNELYKVIDSSDVVIHVLDARDPLGTRCRSVEKYIREEAPHKHLLFLLNKCDLVPTSVAARWVKMLSKEYPTLAFHASLTNSFGKGSLISLLRQFSSLHQNRKQISVGFIGYPNTGKSSIINTLRKKKVCTTAPVPGETKVWQYITLMKRIYLIDCPGIVPPQLGDTSEELLLRGVVRVENVENPAQYIPAVLARCQRKYIERTYELTGWAGAAAVEENEGQGLVGTAKTDKEKLQEATKFLEALARKGGRLLKGGEADLDGVAKMVINDFLRGKIPWFTPPPKAEGAEAEDDKGRDEKLGLMSKKRKRGIDESTIDTADLNTSEGKAGVAAEEAKSEENGGEGLEDEDENEDEESEGDDFDGFDENDSDDIDDDEDEVPGRKGVSIELGDSNGSSDASESDHA